MKMNRIFVKNKNTIFYTVGDRTKEILSQNKSEGVLVGPAYQYIFDETVPKKVSIISLEILFCCHLLRISTCSQ